MTTAAKQKFHEHRFPNGKVLRRLSRSAEPVDVEALKKQRDQWLEENRQVVEGYSVEQFLREKHHDVESGLL